MCTFYWKDDLYLNINSNLKKSKVLIHHLKDVYRGVTVAFLLRYSDGQFSTVLSCFVLLSQNIFEFSDKERERESKKGREMGK
jgi:hypothetical protein